jgi:hypothetical protein
MSSTDTNTNTNTNSNSTATGSDSDSSTAINGAVTTGTTHTHTHTHTHSRRNSMSSDEVDGMGVGTGTVVDAIGSPNADPIAMDDDIAIGMNEDTCEMIRQTRTLTGELQEERAQVQLQRERTRSESHHSRSSGHSHSYAMESMQRQVTAWQRHQEEDAWELGNIPDDIREAFHYHDPAFKGSHLYEWPEEKLLKLVDHIKPEHLDGILGRELGQQLPRAETLTWDKLHYTNKRKHTLLDHVTGALRAGELVGILG